MIKFKKEIIITINQKNLLSCSIDLDSFIMFILNQKNITQGFFELTFMTNNQIKKINKQYLNHNYSTDVITFNLGNKDNISADIYISIDQAKKNACDYNSSLTKEIQLLIIHGILHCLNYNDDTEKNKKIMFQEQDRLLQEYSIC